MRRTIGSRQRRVVTSLAALLTVLGAWQIARASGQDEGGAGQRRFGFRNLRVIGLTDDGRLAWFRTHSPERTRDIGSVTGLGGSDTALVGIDFRVQDGKLYGVGNGGGVYTIDTRTAQAQFVNALTVPLTGTRFGVDFNPAADRLRIVSDTGQNLAHNVNAGGVTVNNGTLTYTAPPALPVAALGVTAAAYTNNDLNQPGTGTTLFDLDTMLDQVVIQSPPANGILAATGKLGADAGAAAGFDIFSDLMRGVTIDNFGFASLIVNGKYRFYALNLTTGSATPLGLLGEAVVDIAVPLNQ
jgi:hypothetical protein